MSKAEYRTIRELHRMYHGGKLTVEDMAREVLSLCYEEDPAWIHILSEKEIFRQIEDLNKKAKAQGIQPAMLPLYGIPFAVKDNIDVKGLPTSAGCPDYTYTAKKTATAVVRLMEAGAVLIGKTNLDQFATGLVGVRSPYGAVPNSFDPRYISGGSSSGSASVVSRGIVTFSLGTDTAGSGRVPAGFNNLVGLKPTRGVISTRGVVPACRSLDCISIFSLTPEDAEIVYQITAGFDSEDPYSRIPESRYCFNKRKPLFAIPEKPEFFGDTLAGKAFTDGLETLKEMNVELESLDFNPLHALAELLYEGPWVAERYSAIKDFFNTNREAMDPVVADIIGKAADFSAADCFAAEYKRQEILQTMHSLFDRFDALVVPAAPTIYTIEEIKTDPVRLNSRLGIYTNFVNLADWSAIVFPGPFRADGLPAGLTLIGPCGGEDSLMDFAKAYYRRHPWNRGNSRRNEAESSTLIAVAGAHLKGFPLNHELTDLGASLLKTTKTTGNYRMFSLAGTNPPKPGLVRMSGGNPQEVEIWDIPLLRYGEFVSKIPSPLSIGQIELENGEKVQGFLCEQWAVDGSEDISRFGGWRYYQAGKPGKKEGTSHV